MGLLILSANLFLRLLWIGSCPFESFWCLFIRKLLEKEHHELVTIVLHDWIKFSLQDFLNVWVDNPSFCLTTLAEDDIEEVVEFIVVFKIVLNPCFVLVFSILLHYEMITQIVYRYKALKAGIHVAVVCIIVETYYAIFKRWWLLVFLQNMSAVEVIVWLPRVYRLSQLNLLILGIVDDTRTATM